MPPRLDRRGRRYALLATGLLALPAARLAAPAAVEGRAEEPERPPQKRPTLEAARVEVGPTLDGNVTGDEVWSHTTPVEGFWQTTPDEGRPSTQRTEVLAVYTADTLYLGIVCHDRNPEEIIVADSRRDSPLDETDSVLVILDTYRDHQSGFVFGTNPAGIEYDGQVIREGEGGFRGAGGFNLAWDGDWEVRTEVGPTGWSAEMAIPFRTLRYPRGRVQHWGFNVQRNIRRRNERAFWAPLPRQFNLYRLSLAGSLTGLEVPSQRNLKLVPYALAESSEVGIEGAERRDDEEAGFDVKWSVTPSLTLDATYNTDFAQVEADELQINLDRFNLFFPEKRPFFLENAGLFSVGVPQELELFYSRRIGLGPDGEEVPIDWGARMSGKSGAYNLGLLYMQAEPVAGVAPREGFAVGRVSRDLPNRSSVGAIVIGREGLGAGATEDDENLTYAVDGRWGIGEYTTLEAFAARTETPGITEDDYAFRVGGGYNSETWTYEVNYAEVGEGFNPEVGFLTRTAYRKPDAFILRTVRPRDLWGLQELRPHVSYTGYWDFDGFHETGFLHIDNHWEWKNGYEVHTGVNFVHEGLKEPFEISEGIVVPAGSYDNEELQLIFWTNQGAPLSFETRIVAGGFFDGDRVAMTPVLRFRIGERFTTAVSWQHNDIDLEAGSFETNLGRARISYSFTPRIFVQGLVQYNDRADLWASNLRFGWLNRANTGLYVVYNEIRDIGRAGTGIPDRSVTVKFSYMFDLLRQSGVDRWR
ncbi:MAG: DUF5916 domain-containing protein [Thermoanaerobaculia bacterium]|nr:DUF5916 domain-containing protein [Thermoanaerobaculia bacterium]